jgi:quinol---cytochrome c reductase cytochrome b subunit, bacillus type
VNLTESTQRLVRRTLTLEDALPTRLPVYVGSIVYLFGAIALMSFLLLVITGVLLALGGPFWYHTNSVGRFIDYLHFWSVQAFFFGIISHFITKFFMGAWRAGRWLTWMVGSLLLATGIFTGLTGYLMQTNWDSQWISTQAKDAMNAGGIGALFNTMNTGQVLMLHAIVMPLVVGVLIGLHLLLIRRESPVRPYED